MKSGQARLTLLYWDANRGGHLECPAALIPAPGQYVLAHAASDTHHPLPIPLFAAAATPTGFDVAGQLPAHWQLGQEITLRGPLGRGFQLSPAARKIALWAANGTPARLLALLPQALSQGASITLVGAKPSPTLQLPAEIELAAPEELPHTLNWADTLCVDCPRETLQSLLRSLQAFPHLHQASTQILVETHMPCGGTGACAACAVLINGGWLRACDDGPVFPWYSLVK